MATYYNASTSPNVTLTVASPDVYYNTSLALQLIDGTGAVLNNPTVKSGATVKVKATLTATGAGAVVGAHVNITLTRPDYPTTPVYIPSLPVTDANGAVVYDLSSAIASASASQYGVWTLAAQFAGQLPSAYAGGFAPAANFLHLGFDDPGFYYENGQLAHDIYGAHGTPYLPGGADVVHGIYDMEVGTPVNKYGMVDPGDAYGYNYWGSPTLPPAWNDYQDPENLMSTGFGNTYVDTNVTDRSGGVEDSIQHAQSINFYRPNAYPGYLGDPQFNNYGNQYVDTNVTDRSGGNIESLQAQQNPNFYRNAKTDPNKDIIQAYYGPILAPQDINDPLFTMWANEPNAYAPSIETNVYYDPVTGRKVLETY